MAKGVDIKIDVRGIDKILREQPHRSDRWLAGVAETMVTEVKLSMTDSPPDTSRAISVGKGRVHYPSLPGNPPRVDTGALRASIRAAKVGHLHYEIRDGVEYGEDLEFGLKRGGAPRPFMRPVFDRWRKQIVADAVRNLVQL